MGLARTLIASGSTERLAMAIRGTLCWLLAAVISGSSVSVRAASPVPAGAPVQGTCLAEQDKPDLDGAAAEAAALKFVQSLNAGDVTAIAGQMTTVGRAATTDAQITATLKAMRSFGVVGAPTLTKAYVLNVNAAPAATGIVPCMSPAPNPEWDSVAVMGPAGKQAHVLFAASSAENVVNYVIWLRVEGGAWRVTAFYVGSGLMGGRSGADWWEVAKKQRQEGHDFNAALAYSTARNLLYRGPNYSGPTFISLMQDARTMSIPQELVGPFPMNWTLDGRAFRIALVSPVGTSGKRAVLAIAQLSDFADNPDADRQNHILIDAFNKAHPEWREVFDWLAVKTCKTDGSLCFGSVYDRKDGYLHGPPS
jgi:hypothetical protein